MKKYHVGALVAAGCMVVTGLAAATPSSAASSKSPVVIADVSIQTGPYATPGRNNDLNLAVSQLNAKGGIAGHPVKVEFFDSSLTPEQAVTATQQAIGVKPTLITGYSIDDQVQASASLLKSSGIPVISWAQGPAAASKLVGVPNLYTVVPNLVSAIQGAAVYAFKTYHPTTVGIFHTEDTASDADAAVAESLLKAEGVKNFVVNSAADAATDATEQALAMKGASVVFEYGFPLVEAVFNTALTQNGITAPIMGDQSGNSLAGDHLNTPAELTKYTFTPYCFAPVLKTAAAKAYVSAYTAAYPGQSLQLTTPYGYDDINMLAAAVKADGGSLSASKLVKTLGTMTYNGVCGTYHSDAAHELIHQVTEVSFAKGINPGTLAAKYTEKPVPAKYMKSSFG